MLWGESMVETTVRHTTANIEHCSTHIYNGVTLCKYTTTNLNSWLGCPSLTLHISTDLPLCQKVSGVPKVAGCLMHVSYPDLQTSRKRFHMDSDEIYTVHAGAE